MTAVEGGSLRGDDSRLVLFVGSEAVTVMDRNVRSLSFERRSGGERARISVMSAWEETSYPVPQQPLRLSCLACGTAIAGGLRGSGNIRSILKEIKSHDDELHPPYDPSVIGAVTRAVQELNAGLPAPRRAGRLSIDWAGAPAESLWRQSAEVLEQRIGVLVEQRGDLERALERMRHERDELRDQLVEALKEIDVLTGVRDALRAELIKAQPSRRTTGWLAEVAKTSAGALAGALMTVGAQWALDLEHVERSASTIVEHADVVITDCESPNLGQTP